MPDSLIPNSPQNLALARKWRPKDFNSLVGQEHVVKALTHALDQNRLHHAWLFTGTRGVGKTTISRILAKSLNCIGVKGDRSSPTSQPCGVCVACREIDAGRFVDYIEMDAASNRGVEEMASLLEKAVYAPTNARYKVYMIDEVHMLTSHAFNSMLKTLEEPPPYVKFILATTDPQKIPVTVLSRCLQFNLKQMPPALIVSHLQGILEQEKIEVEFNALKILAKAAQGSMRDALSLTDQAIAYSAGDITETAVRNMLGTLDDAYLIRILESLHQKDGRALIQVADEMGLSSMSFSLALQDLASLLQKIAMAQVIPGAVLDEWPEAEPVKRLASTFSREEVQLFYQIAITSRPDLSLAPDEQAGFTMALLRMLAFRPVEAGGISTQSSPQSQSTASTSGASSPAQTASTARPGLVSPLRSVETAIKKNEPPKFEAINSTETIEKVMSPIEVAPMSTSVASPKASVQLEAPVDWQQLIKTFPLRGLSQQFAYQTELKSWVDQGNVIQIGVITAMPQIATDDAVARLCSLLEGHFGKSVKMKVEAGEAQKTVAVADANAKQVRQAKAENDVSSNPFVQQLEKEFGAKVIEGSSRPL